MLEPSPRATWYLLGKEQPAWALAMYLGDVCEASLSTATSSEFCLDDVCSASSWVLCLDDGYEATWLGPCLDDAYEATSSVTCSDEAYEETWLVFCSDEAYEGLCLDDALLEPSSWGSSSVLRLDDAWAPSLVLPNEETLLQVPLLVSSYEEELGPLCDYLVA